MAYPQPKGVAGTRACQQTTGRVQALGTVPWEGPRDMAKAGLPEAQSPVDGTSRPPERRLEPAPCPAPGMAAERGTLRDTGRCPARVLKEMSGPPTSRSDVQQ